MARDSQQIHLSYQINNKSYESYPKCKDFATRIYTKQLAPTVSDDLGEELW
jgi:hypothetical protein